MHPALGKRLCSYFVFFLCFALAAAPQFSRAAELVLDPATASQAMGTEFAVKVVVDPGTDSVNAADGNITFDSDVLSVVGISKDASAFSLWTADPTFSNADGTITFSGGTPSAFSAKSTVLTIRFVGKKEGTAAVSFSKGSILAADGKGTDVYKKGPDASFTITAVAVEEEPSAEEDIAESDVGKPPAPSISSATHPKEENWYATSTAEFSWKPPVDVTNVRILFTDKEDASPNVSRPITVISEKKTGVADGVWYAFVQFKNDAGWGEIGKRKLQIDTEPPSEFEVALVEGDIPKFAFLAEDALSGVEKYDIVLGGSVVATVKASDLVDGAHPVPPQEGGAQVVTVKAYDKAGNIREAKKELTLPAVAKPKPKGEEEELKESIWSIELVLAILFAIIIGAVTSWNVYMRKMGREEKMKILHEVALVRDKNDKIFSAMREEFEELVGNLDERPQLTPAERDFLEKMKEALEISEEVIDSSMEELKKMIHG